MIAIAVSVAVLIAGGTLLLSVLNPADWMLDEMSEQLPGVVFRIDTAERAIALTIDDAPHPDVTPGLLRVLAAHDARATFFIIGSNAEAHPALIDSIRIGGHELANHFFTDRMSAGLSDEEFVQELRRTEAAIAPLRTPKWCRPGSGIITQRAIRLIEKSGYLPVLGTAYPVDLFAGVDLTVAHFMENIRPGAILVLHDGGPDREHNIEVLAALLPRIEAEGYRLVTLTELSRLGAPVARPPTP
jgi:peptidoglycan/xylan/chitin deacetylase (PgdA/CDA1 family)